MAIVSLYHHCLSWLALCHHPGTWNLFGVTCHRWGAPRDSVKPCGYPTSCHDALRWPKERYQEPVLAAGERTGCVPCNLATQICPSLMGDIQAQFAGEYSNHILILTHVCVIYIYTRKHIYLQFIQYNIYILYPYIFTYIHKRSEKHLSFLAVWEIEQTSLSFSRIGNDQVFFDLWGQANHS